MKVSCRKAIVVASAALASMGALRNSSATTLIQNNQSAQVDGWNITAPKGVSLTVTFSGSEISVQKAANFSAANQGFQVASSPWAAPGPPHPSISLMKRFRIIPEAPGAASSSS